VSDAILSSLNSQQQAAVKHMDGPSLVLAGAGSGKTRVLTHRTAYLIDQGIDPQNILLVTFTNKAAGEMKERVHKLLGAFPATPATYPATHPHIGTFHATCAQILRLNGEHIGLSSRYLIYDTADQLSLIRQVIEKLKLSKSLKPAAIKSFISSAKCELIGPKKYAQYARGYYQELAAEIYPVYQKMLRENEALDFGDLIMETVKLFREFPEVLSQHQNKFRYLMVDEYQDTNLAQYTLTKLLTGIGDTQNLCVVGDCSQSIYAFRGANLGNVLKFKGDFPQTKIFHLERNYRSTKTILSAATQVIKTNRHAHPVLDLWTDNEQGQPIVIYYAIDHVDEAQFVIHQIQKLRNYDLNDFAVLYRTNAQSRALEEVFLHSHLPYRLVGGVHFYERKEIKDILAYLRLIANPKDGVSFKRAVNTPPRGIGPVTLKQGGPKLEHFQALIESYRHKSKRVNIVDLIDNLLERINFKEYLDDGTESGITRWENVLELKSVAQSFAKLSPEESIFAFLENVSLMERTEISTRKNESLLTNREESAVNLMTLHAVKGLEFPVIFIIGMEEGLLPHSRSLMERTALEEERRLAYVGITRARERLFLTHTQSRLYFGQQRIFPPSRFLKDLPEELVVRKRGLLMS